MASIFRRTIISQFVSHYVNRYFKTNGIYVEAGCGTGETSIRIRKCAFIRVGLDISPEALKRVKSQQTYNHYILGDIFNIPFKEESIDGIWNVGVMEHFDCRELSRVFREFNRVLKPEGCCLFFWPWILAPSHVIFRFYEMIMKRFERDKQIFPVAPSMINKKLLPAIYKMNKNLGFTKISFHFPWMDLTHFAIVMIKNDKSIREVSRK